MFSARPLPQSSKEFLKTCRDQHFNLQVNTEGKYELGEFPPREEQLGMYVGLKGIDVKETAHWRYNVAYIKKNCGVDLFPLLRNGLTDVFVSGDRQHNLAVAQQTLNGTRLFIPMFRYLAREKIVPIAVSYKHGKNEQLSLQRLFDGICALELFLEPGTKFVLWLDLVISNPLRRRNPCEWNASWLKRGLLPYQLFVTLFLDNATSGRPRDDYVNSFWLNIEGVLATLGSGMIMVGKDLKRNAVESWMFEDKRADIPIQYVLDDENIQIAYRPGNTMDCNEALQFLLQNAIKGAYDNKTVRYNEDKDGLIRMANCVFHCKSWEDFGKVAYDLEYSDYETLFATLSADTTQDHVWNALEKSGRTFANFFPGIHTMYPTYIETRLGLTESSSFTTSWLPQHCRFFNSTAAAQCTEDVWFHFQSAKTVVAAIGIAVIAAPNRRRDGKLHVRLLQVANSSAGVRNVVKAVDLWDARIPSLLGEVLRVLEGEKMNLIGVQKLLIDSGVECDELSSFFVAETFEHIESSTWNQSDLPADSDKGEGAVEYEESVDKEIAQSSTEKSRVPSKDDSYFVDETEEDREGPVQMSLGTNTLHLISKYFHRMKFIEENEEL